MATAAITRSMREADRLKMIQAVVDPSGGLWVLACCGSADSPRLVLDL